MELKDDTDILLLHDGFGEFGLDGITAFPRAEWLAMPQWERDWFDGTTPNKNLNHSILAVIVGDGDSVFKLSKSQQPHTPRMIYDVVRRARVELERDGYRFRNATVFTEMDFNAGERLYELMPDHKAPVPGIPEGHYGIVKRGGSLTVLKQLEAKAAA